MLTNGLHWALALLLAGLPFEPVGGLPIAGLTFTAVELLAMATIALWVVALLVEQRLPRLPRRLVGWAGLLLAIFVASALLAGPWRGAALKFTLRQVQGLLLGLCVADQLALADWRVVRRLGLALAAGAAASAACGLLELTEHPLVMSALMLFKYQPTTAGGLLRLSATFAYANIAAMYYEAVLPMALVGVGLAQGWRARWALAIAALLLYLAALLTYSRAALVTATVVIVVVAAASVFRRSSLIERAASRRMLAVAGALLAVLIALLTISPIFRTRIAEPDVDRWYRADYLAAALPPLAANELVHTSVTVTNRGLVTWRPDGARPIRLAYHWLDARSRLVVRYNGTRTELPGPVAPGQAIVLDALLQAPSQPGQYLLVWDMVSEESGWFSERGNASPEFAVAVAGAAAPQIAPPTAEPAGVPQRIEARPQPPARSQLWAAALRLWLAHPVLGIGPDVFRHVYGPELNLAVWDDSIHTNNLYIEVLVGSGLAGLIAFVGLIAAIGWAALRALASVRHGNGPTWRRWWALLGCVAALIAFLVHGTLDMFLEFNSTYLLLWMLLGALDVTARAPAEKEW